METCLEQFNETTFNQMQGYILSESVGVDYQHTASFMTALMVGIFTLHSVVYRQISRVCFLEMKDCM